MGLSGRAKSVACWAGVGVVALGLRLVVYLAGARLLPPSSDESIAMLLAGDVARGGFPLLFLAQPYLFPIESYLAAPLSFLPPSAWACRVLPFIVGLVVTGLALVLVPRSGSRRTRWLGVGLAILPSCYVLLLQGFITPPGYSFLMLVCVSLPVLFQRVQATGLDRWAFLAGLLSGLGFAAHSLSMCMSLPTLLAMLVMAPRARLLRRWMSVGMGVVLGLAPGLLAMNLIQGAHELATETHPWREVLARSWSPGIKFVLTSAIGLRPISFPDTAAGPLAFDLHAGVVAWTLLLVLAAGLGWRLLTHAQSIARRTWPAVTVTDLLLATIVLNILLFAAAPRAHSSTWRYFVPAALAFPLLLARIMVEAPRGLRQVGWLAGLILLLVQIPTGLRVAEAWRKPDFAADMGLPSLQPALRVLDQLNIRHVVASYGAAYRINYESDRRVLASQPFNERFPTWPLPYKEDVDSATNVAYVLTDAISHLKPRLFEEHLRIMDVTARRQTAGHFMVYHDFKGPPPLPTQRQKIGTASMNVTGALSATLLIDGSAYPAWRSQRTQQAGDTITLQWENDIPVEYLVLEFPLRKDRPNRLRVTLRENGVWSEQSREVGDRLEEFEFLNGHPVYGRLLQHIHLDGAHVNGVRLEIVEPRTGRDWTISEIELHGRAPALTMN